MASYLSAGKLNLDVLRNSYRRELIDCLDKFQGSKALVWDDALTGPVGLVAEYTLLKEHEVDKMFPLKAGRLPPNSVQNVVFIVRPKLSLMELIAQNVIKEEESSGHFRKEFHIIFVPRKSILCENKLKELGCVPTTFANIDDFCMELIPFDNDLLSMEMDLSFRNHLVKWTPRNLNEDEWFVRVIEAKYERVLTTDCVKNGKQCHLEKDPTSLFHVARALMTLQAIYGVIPNISGKGDCAADVVDMMMRMRREMAGAEPQIMPQIDNLLIIDRMVDPLTPLLSQLTYEGLIDEIFNINNTTVKLPPEKFVASSNGAPSTVADMPAEPKKVILNSSEELFGELRDKNFHAVGPALSRKAKLISAEFDERHAAKTVGDIKQFVSKLPHMQAAKSSLATHTAIAELIKEVTDTDEFMGTLSTEQEFINGLETDKAHPYIEDCIAKEESLVKVLRLICIQCYCNSGFKPKLLEYYKRELIQTYGFQHLVTIHNLESVGLLKVQGTTKNYPTIRKTLKLIVEEVNEQNPNDISYVYSGYAPLSVRLAHVLHRPGWRSIADILNMLPGQTTEDTKQAPPSWTRKRHGSGGSTHSSTSEQQKVTLVFFLGGVTYAEVSALRFLSQLEDGPTDYIIATTKLINGNTWIESLMNKYTPKPPNPF